MLKRETFGSVRECWPQWAEQYPNSVLSDPVFMRWLEQEAIQAKLTPTYDVYHDAGRVVGVHALAFNHETKWWIELLLPIRGQRFPIPVNRLEEYRVIARRPFVLDDNTITYHHGATTVPEWCVLMPASIIQPAASLDAYLQTLSKKQRYHCRKTLEMNADLTVKVALPGDHSCAHPFDVNQLVEMDIERMAKRVPAEDMPAVIQQLRFYQQRLAHRARAVGNLCEVAIYDKDELIALNYALVENGVCSDYVCYWDESYADRSLGIFAILKNYEAFITLPGARYYDLMSVATEFGYKQRLSNVQHHALVFSLFNSVDELPPDPLDPPYVVGDSVVWGEDCARPYQSKRAHELFGESNG